MSKGQNTAGHPGRQVHRDRFTGGDLVGSLDLDTGDLYDTGGKPLAGSAADRAKQKEDLAAKHQAWEEWHADYERKAREK